MPFPATGNGLSKSISLSFSVEWSKIDRYDSYLDYQRQLRDAVGGKSPIEWELENWLLAAEYYL